MVISKILQKIHAEIHTFVIMINLYLIKLIKKLRISIKKKKKSYLIPHNEKIEKIVIYNIKSRQKILLSEKYTHIFLNI
jgi:hypothetical protein